MAEPEDTHMVGEMDTHSKLF